MKYLIILAVAFASCSDAGGPEDPTNYILQHGDHSSKDMAGADGIEVDTIHTVNLALR